MGLASCGSLELLGEAFDLPSCLALVFGEDYNDQAALVNLLKALRPPGVSLRAEVRRKPLVLARDAVRKGARRRMASDIASFYKAAQGTGRYVVAIVHRDCDAVEPAHVACASALLEELEVLGVDRVVVAAPAWEIETWWMLFPAAIANARACWRRVDYKVQNVGMFTDAKERLRRDLRPISAVERNRCRDYSESDGIKIAEYIACNPGQIGSVRATSNSFVAFCDGVKKVFDELT